MLPWISPSSAPISPSHSSKLHLMFSGSEGVFRMRQVLSDLSNSVVYGRASVLRFSVRSHLDAYPRLMANGGRFNLPEDRDFYSDVLLAAAMPEDDFPAFTTATSILLMDLLQNGEGTDNLFWNWDSFEGHYRMADAKVRAAIMNAFRLGFEMGNVRTESTPTQADCLTNSKEQVIQSLTDDGFHSVANAVSSGATDQDAGALWMAQQDLRAAAGFRYLYERPVSLVPTNQETAPLIPWS